MSQHLTRILLSLFLLAFAGQAFTQVAPDSLQPDSATQNTKSSGVKTKTSEDETTPMNAEQIRQLLIQRDTSFANKEIARQKAQEKAEKGEDKPKKEFDPDRAWKRSAILPGWGQFYNRNYWKPPIIYAGFAGLTYSYIFNNSNYLSSRSNYICSLDTNCLTYSLEQSTVLRNEREFYRRNRDLTIVIGVLWYALNVVDAYIEAHLKDFNVTDDISMKIKPSLDYLPHRRDMTVGAKVTFTFR